MAVIARITKVDVKNGTAFLEAHSDSHCIFRSPMKVTGLISNSKDLVAADANNRKKLIDQATKALKAFQSSAWGGVSVQIACSVRG